MIPTHLKSKLPRHLSYPIGAEAISEGLADAPHVEAFTLMFRDNPVWPASEFQRLLRERLPYPIMVGEFHPTRRPGYGGAQYLIETGWYNEEWKIVVYPVARELRHLATQLLREQGL